MLTGLLLDSGDTLMHPKGGRWDPRFDFEETLERHIGPIPIERLPRAIAAGDRHIAAWSGDPATTDWKQARADYHREVLAELGVHSPSAELLDELDRPLPFTDIVEPFDDVATWLPRLRDEGWSIAIVADTGSGMVDAYRDFDLHHLIDVFVISAELGCTKPDPRMYHTASGALGLEPADCIFVDNDPGNVRAAIDLGYRGCGISRYRDPPTDGLCWVQDLADLHTLVTPRSGRRRSRLRSRRSRLGRSPGR